MQTPICERIKTEKLYRETMRAYKVFIIVKTGRNAADQCGLFFETSIDRRGTIVQVTGGGRGGMRLQRQTETALDARTWDDARRDHVGWVMEARFQRVWDVRVPPPGRRDARSKTAREWTELVMRQLQAQRVMESNRERSETTAAEETEEDEGVEEGQGEPLRLGILPPRVEVEEEEISEEE